MRRLIVLIVVLIVVLGIYSAAQQYVPQLSSYLSQHAPTNNLHLSQEKVSVVTEESVTINAVKKYGPSVVTVIEQSNPQQSSQNQSPFQLGPFSIFGAPFDQGNGGHGGSSSGGDTSQPVAIGSGFIVTSDGLVVTNKHVVGDEGAPYQVVTSDDKKYKVQKIYRDPLNDIAIIKIDPGEHTDKMLQPMSLGDSSNLQVGQFVIAIGTALGEFRNSVTTGVVSGLGRGITAGDQFQGVAEQLDNVIQTSAAINPGNSGGPLLNSAAQVIGINTAVSQSGQNIGFALPINAVKDSLNNFNQTGQFNRPFLGVAYKMISQDLSIANDIPQGAYVQQVVSGSPAEKAGLQQGDVITKLDGNRLTGNNALTTAISKKKVGDTLHVTYWRDGNTHDIDITLGQAPQQ